MKKLLSAATLLFAASSFTYAQCDKPVTLTASKTEYLNADSIVERTVEEKAAVRIDKSSITVSSEKDKTMTGVIHSYTCGWTVPYKQGKTMLKADFTDGNESKHVMVTITGNGTAVTLLWKMEGRDQMIRVVADKFEETKD